MCPTPIGCIGCFVFTSNQPSSLSPQQLLRLLLRRQPEGGGVPGIWEGPQEELGVNKLLTGEFTTPNDRHECKLIMLEIDFKGATKRVLGVPIGTCPPPPPRSSL